MKKRTILSRIYALHDKGKDAKQIAKAIDRSPNYVRTALWRMRNPETVKAYNRAAGAKRYGTAAYNKRVRERQKERYWSEPKYRARKIALSSRYQKEKRLEARA